jgi:hypothetical protein
MKKREEEMNEERTPAPGRLLTGPNKHGGRQRRALRAGLALAAALALAAGTSAVSAAAAAQAATVGRAAPPPHVLAPGQPDLGPNVFVFSPSMPLSQIQATVNSIAAQQVPNQFGTQRYTLLFEPGTYGSAADPLNFQVGYYTEVAGLGSSPNDVTINGTIDVFNQCFPSAPGTTNCIALDNFWRSLSNLTISIAGRPSGCQANTDFWAVSQAAPMRRVDITGGKLSLMDFCSAGPQFASGGFIADSAFSGGTVINGSQQQFLVRNSNLDGWSNGVWDQVFSGDVGAPPQSFSAGDPGPTPPYTTLATSPVTQEKPFLFTDSQSRFEVFVPALQHNTVGPSWAAGPTPGKAIPLSRFFIATPADSAALINEALESGQNLILTPGVYNTDRAIEVTRPGTVVLGLGFATIVPKDGNVAMRVDSVPGVKLSGIIFDAGPVNSPVLLQVGEPGFRASSGRNRDEPTLVQDVFFRIGGAEPGRATTAFVVNSSNTILDDIWSWRADHGSGVGWTDNVSNHGLIVNGNDVTAYGLFVEHYQKTQVIWRGQGGTDIFFQNEMPYDPPSQAAWMDHGADGYPAFEVGRDVSTFQGYGMASYCFFNQGVPIFASEAFKVPVTPAVQLHDILTRFLNASGGINSVVNGTGAPVNQAQPGPSDVVSYP